MCCLEFLWIFFIFFKKYYLFFCTLVTGSVQLAYLFGLCNVNIPCGQIQMEGTSQFKSCILFTQNENENNTDSVPPQEIIRLQDSIREINTAHGLAANCHILPDFTPVSAVLRVNLCCPGIPPSA